MQGWGRRGKGREMGGGRRGRRSRPDSDSSVAPSLCSPAHPHFPPPLAEHSILCRPLVLTPRVSPLPQLVVIASFSPRHLDNFLLWCLGLEGCFAREGFP